MRRIILELLIFRFFLIDAWKYIFKAIIFIHAVFIHKIKVFLKIFIREISDMPLILYFSHVFISNAVLEKISRKMFFLNIRTLLFDSPILPQT